ncbi:MAG TPA: tetratricopeptide repeat protein [Desulfomonilia bacterium]|nr:tetratricopeptide repeat protein [Desulfomonilia bacterium]
MILGRYEEDRGDFQKALELYSRVEDPFAWLAKARVYFMIEDNASALASLQKVIEEGTYIGEALEMRTRIYAKDGNWQLAIKDTEALVKKYPDNIQIKLFLANLRTITGEFKQAQAILKSLIGKGDDSIIYYTISKVCMGERDFTCAKDALKKVIDARQDFAPAYLDLARIQDLLNEPAQAEETYRKLLDVDPFSNDAHMALVDHYIDQKRYKDAIAHLKAYIEVNPDSIILRKLIILELQEGMFEEALILIKGLKDTTDDDKYYLALAYAGLEKYDDALDILKDIPMTGRLGCDTTMLKSSILKSMNKFDQAVALLESVWKDYADLGTCNEIGYQLATELDALGRRDEGLKIAEMLLDKDPQDPIALNFIGYVWADRDMNLDKAYSMIKEALGMKPDDPFILDSMAWVLYKMGKPQEALLHIEKVLKILKDDPIVNEHMGDILKSLGQTDKALDYYLKSSILNRTINSSLKDKIKKLIIQDEKEVSEPKEKVIP